MSFLTRTAVCTIKNNSDQLLTRKQGHLSHGEWLGGFPPDYIKPGSSGSWTSQTAGLFTGVEGVAQYSLRDESVFEVRWDNPYVGANSFSQIRTPNGDRATAPVSYDDAHADDLNVTFVLGPLSVPAPAPASVPPPAPAPSIPEVPSVQQIVANCKGTTHVSKPGRYDRCSAIEYAKTHALTPCTDGFVALAVQPGYLELSRSDLDKELEVLGEGLRMDDCTHFVSSCIGSPYDVSQIAITASKPGLNSGAMPRAKAGGLYIPPDVRIGNSRMYGLIGVPQLMAHLLGPSGLGEVVPFRKGAPYTRGSEGIPAGIEAGDVIVKYTEDTDTKALTPQHSLSYLGIAQAGEFLGKPIFACHTQCRIAAWPIFAVDYYTFIHIRVSFDDTGLSIRTKVKHVQEKTASKFKDTVGRSLPCTASSSLSQHNQASN